MFPKLLTELLGTMLLVFTIGLAVSAGALAPLAIGAALIALVYMGGHVSGAHYNPAVTLGAMWAGEFPRRDVVRYITAQFAGAVVGAVLVWMVLSGPLVVAPTPSSRYHAYAGTTDWRMLGSALLIEAIFTMMLVLVVLNVAFHLKTKGNPYFGLAIGLTIAAAAAAGGGISGGAFNPAVGLGSFFVALIAAPKAVSFSYVWIYLVGPIVGAAIAAGIYRVQRRV